MIEAVYKTEFEAASNEDISFAKAVSELHI